LEVLQGVAEMDAATREVIMSHPKLDGRAQHDCIFFYEAVTNAYASNTVYLGFEVLQH
jgi:hypothetical protein